MQRASQRPRRISATHVFATHRGAAKVVDEAATLRITSLPSFLLGSTFHGRAAFVKHQMACRPRAMLKPNGAARTTHEKDAGLDRVRQQAAEVRHEAAFETKFQIALQR